MQNYATDEKILIAWGFGDYPTIASDGTPMFHHYVVSRGFMGDYSDAVIIGRTQAEFFKDEDIAPSLVYVYRVQGADDEAETTLTDVCANPVVFAAPEPPVNNIPPSAPSGLRATGKAGGIEWKWDPSTLPDSSRLLGYIVEDSSVTSPRGMVYEVDAPTTTWTEPVPTGGSRTYRLRGIDVDLNVSEPSEIVTGTAGGRPPLLSAWRTAAPSEPSEPDLTDVIFSFDYDNQSENSGADWYGAYLYYGTGTGPAVSWEIPEHTSGHYESGLVAYRGSGGAWNVEFMGMGGYGRAPCYVGNVSVYQPSTGHEFVVNGGFDGQEPWSMNPVYAELGGIGARYITYYTGSVTYIFQWGYLPT